MKRTELVKTAAGCLWGCLGFYRGHQYYNKEYMKEVKWNEKKQYYYITDFAHCVAGTCFYVSPITLPALIIHEMYNLEKAIRRIKCDD